MTISNIDFTASDVKYTYDLSDNQLFKKDPENYINELSIEQLNTIGKASLLDIFLSKDNLIEPHYHPNASEILYCISGTAIISIINPFTTELINSVIKQGEVASVPQGWWHYITATSNKTHLLSTFDTPLVQTVFGSDALRLTPPKVLAHAYCLDKSKVADALAPITKTVIIGPPIDCPKVKEHKKAYNHRQETSEEANSVVPGQNHYIYPC